MPVLLGSKTERAVIVAVPDALFATVTVPVAVTVTLSELEIHVTACGAKFVVSTVAESCADCPALIVIVDGFTVTFVTVGSPGTNRSACANGDTLKIFHV